MLLDRIVHVLVRIVVAELHQDVLREGPICGQRGVAPGLAGCGIGGRRFEVIRWAADRHVVLSQVANGRSGINQFALLVADRTHDQLERVGLFLREGFGDQGVRLERALRRILNEAVGDSVHLVALFQDRGVTAWNFAAGM